MTALVVFIEHRLLKAVFFQRHTDTHRAMAYTAPEQRRAEKKIVRRLIVQSYFGTSRRRLLKFQVLLIGMQWFLLSTKF